jgi:two-component system, chemotaxis family, chemotaxis protein CheY
MRFPAALVVDDDAAIRETLHQLLEDEGYSVAQAPDGVIALETLRSTPDRMVVLLDVMMPRLDGRGVLEAVTDDGRLMLQHRFVVMTAAANTLSGPLMQLMRQVDAPALIKPFNIDRLLALVSEAASQLVN